MTRTSDYTDTEVSEEKRTEIRLNVIDSELREEKRTGNNMYKSRNFPNAV